jgi:hypothetical protein
MTDHVTLATSQLPERVLVTYSQVAGEHEVEFTAWYASHIKDFVSCPGIERACRYRTDSAPFEGAALYQLTAPEALETPEVKNFWGWGVFEGRAHNVEAGVYKRVLHKSGQRS